MEKPIEKTDKKDFSCILWLGIAIAVLIVSVRLGIGPFHNPGPGFLLFWAGILLAVFSGTLFAAGVKGQENSTSGAELWKGRKWCVPFLVAATLFIYGLAMPILGYIPATFVLTAVLFGAGRVKMRLAIPGALLAAVSTFVLFDSLLKMPLPRGPLGF